MSSYLVDVTYYAIQHCCTHASIWLKPLSKRRPVHDKEWAYSSWDYFNCAFSPMMGTGNNIRPRHKKAAEDSRELWRETGQRGWKQIKHAIRAICLVRELDNEGKFDTVDPYGKKCQARRHAFRIMKVRYYVNQVETVIKEAKP